MFTSTDVKFLGCSTEDSVGVWQQRRKYDGIPCLDLVWVLHENHPRYSPKSKIQKRSGGRKNKT